MNIEPETSALNSLRQAIVTPHRRCRAAIDGWLASRVESAKHRAIEELHNLWAIHTLTEERTLYAWLKDQVPEAERRAGLVQHEVLDDLVNRLRYEREDVTARGVASYLLEVWIAHAQREEQAWINLLVDGATAVQLRTWTDEFLSEQRIVCVELDLDPAEHAAMAN